jgi:predicted RNase H-like HicB family nuclease
VNKEPEQYHEASYHRVWVRREDDADPYWVVRLLEIPQVVGDGPTRAEAEAALRQCFLDYVRYALAEGLDVPEPRDEAAAG